MKKVITYGTYDLLHYGHIRLLERAKALGDYLIVGVTADSFDMARGKLNVEQSLMERIEAVRATGLADEIIVEEYEGQKIDDIRRFGVDIFAIGSDWRGKFDYLSEFCQVVYLDRTEGISSTDLRAKEHSLRLALVGESPILNKFERESHFVNGITISGICTADDFYLSKEVKALACKTNNLQELLSVSDAIYVISHPSLHYEQIKLALQQGKHVLCESPITLQVEQWDELQQLASQNNCVLMDSLKTAYSTAYYRLLLLAKSGRIGDIISVDAVCTSMANFEMNKDRGLSNIWNSICAWGPTALLPIFQLLGHDYVDKRIVSHMDQHTPHFDLFTKIAFVYPHAVASLKVGQGVKSEGELVISGTKGYIYVPAPWWKTDYFEIRYENPSDNRRYFYQLDGEGIRYELVSFVKSIQQNSKSFYLEDSISRAIVATLSDFYQDKDLIKI
jgi:choline-phosphate cytidylyltransferase